MTIQEEIFAPEIRRTLAAEDQQSAQWTLTRIQLINWGGFDGAHSVDFDAVATLISGGSGTGKSTLLDAYTALMMPSRIPFNGASNDAGTGRARDEAGGQRTLLTYLRGKQGVVDESGGAVADKVLRGKSGPTWGAVSATFSDSRGAEHTALRLFFVPASATEASAMSSRWALVPAEVDLTDLSDRMAGYTREKHLAEIITSTWPEAKPYSRYSQYSHTLFTRLGIGAGGDGIKAMELLARIQAGRSVDSVNALFRDLVLDDPATFDHADTALAHFDILAERLARIEDTERRHHVLAGIRETWARYDTARSRVAALDTFGLDAPGFTRLSAWTAQTEADLLDQAGRAAQATHRQHSEDLRTAKKKASETYEELSAAKRDYDAAGGGELAALQAEILDARLDVDSAAKARDDLEHLAAQVDATIADRADFDALQAVAADAETRLDDRTVELRDARDAARDDLLAAQQSKSRLEADLTHLERSGTRIRADLGAARDQIAGLLDMDAADLPFLAELIDLREDEEDWRTAAEKVLGGDASRLVIPAARKVEISRRLDGTRYSREIRLIDADADLPLRFSLEGDDHPGRAGTLLSKIRFADHPYAGWAQAHLSAPALNATCVDTPEELHGPGLRVTRSGQVRSGIRSSVGRTTTRNILGFSSATEIEAVKVELETTRAALSDALARVTSVEHAQKALAARTTAYAQLRGRTWESVDVAAARDRLAHLEARLAELTSTDDTLARLSEQIGLLEAEHQERLAARAKAELEAQRSEKAWGDLVDRQDAVTTRLIDHPDVVEALTPEQKADLDAVYAEVTAHARTEGEDPITEASRFGERLAAVRAQLLAKAKESREAADVAAAELTRVFRTYQAAWEDPNLTTNLESYRDYLRILDDLEAEGLYNARADWQRTLAGWSGQDLLPLYQSLSSEVDAIRTRVDPINHILSRIRFGARGGRLRLEVREIGSESVRQFLSQLRRLVSLATADMDFEQSRAAFSDVETFMSRLRKPGDPRYNVEASDRARLLDVRRHVDVYAVEFSPEGAFDPMQHRKLGAASGGESQELIAFIIGSALRFRLGDELRDRPRFTPVFLDEGFVKADAAFSGRAVRAWQNLGFQIVIGSPEDKFTGLEQHMRSFLVAHKDTATGRCYLDPVRALPAPAGSGDSTP